MRQPLHSVPINRLDSGCWLMWWNHKHYTLSFHLPLHTVAFIPHLYVGDKLGSAGVGEDGGGDGMHFGRASPTQPEPHRVPLHLHLHLHPLLQCITSILLIALSPFTIVYPCSLFTKTRIAHRIPWFCWILGMLLLVPVHNSHCYPSFFGFGDAGGEGEHPPHHHIHQQLLGP